MTIHIEALTFDTIIGLLDFERDRPQKVIVDLRASYDYKSDFIDYAAITKLIQEDLKEKRYELLEDALLGLKSIISHNYPRLDTLYLKISKPNIIPECSVALSNEWKLQ